MKTLGNRRDQEEILTRIAQLLRADKGKWGRMAAHEMLCHLTDAYCVALGEKTVRSATGLLQQTVGKWIALRAPVKWMKGYPTRPEIEQGKGGSVAREFEADKNNLLVIVRRFCEDLPQPCLPHPVFGPMEAQEWWRWGYLHADHHLRQFGR